MSMRTGALRPQPPRLAVAALIGLAAGSLAAAAAHAQTSPGPRTLPPQFSEIYGEEIRRAAGWIDAVADSETGEVPASEADWVPAGLRTEEGAARALGLYLRLADPIDQTDAEVALLLLGEIDDPEAVSALAAALGESDFIVERALAPAMRLQPGIVQSRPDDAAEISDLAAPLRAAEEMRSFAAQQRQSFRRLALQSLGRHENALAVEHLRAALDDPDPRTRLVAAQGLSRQPGFPARARVERIAADTPPAFRDLYDPILAATPPVLSRP